AAGAQLRGTVLAAGETVPGFWRDLGMAQAPRGPVLVTFLTTECPWCRITVPRWNRIHAAVADVPGGAAVAVSLSPADSTAGYPAQTGLRIPIHVVGDNAVERRWKVVAVPYTVVMEPSGRVAGSWRGALTDEAVDEVVARLRRSAAGR
ncbi:MAG TPA: hypothetical protein VHG93_18215, partial [Longimicrobium sp.]|nr:hypothetical protein [Longimicrobium sp.]